MSVDYVKLYNLTTLNRKNKINKQKQTIYVCVCVRACACYIQKISRQSTQIPKYVSCAKCRLVIFIGRRYSNLVGIKTYNEKQD